MNLNLGIGIHPSGPAVPYAPRYGAELLSNLSFEEAGGGGADVFASWVETAADGAIEDEGTLVHTGLHAAKITCGATTGATGARIAQTIVTVAGENYRLDFWTRGDNVNAGRFLVYDNSNGAPILALVTTGISGTVYKHITADFTAPAGCVSVDVRFFAGALNGAIAYFDDASVHQVLR